MNWLEYCKHLSDKCKAVGTPLSATFELTPLCNFDCNMCYIHLTKEQAAEQGRSLTTNQWIDIGRQTKQLGTLGLEITGGEALTRPDFSFLYESFIRMGYLVLLRTNGYLLRGAHLDLLKKYKPRSISITLYGASDETYEKVCGIRDGFSIVSHNVLELRRIGIEPVLTMTMTTENIDDRDKLIDWAKQNDINITFYGGLVRPVRSANRDIEPLRIDNRMYETDVSMKIPDRAIPNREKYEHPFWMCRGFGSKFCVSWDGRMTLCNSLTSVWVDSTSQSVESAFHELYGRLNAVRRPPQCASCTLIDYCGACPSQLLSDAGSEEQTCDRICHKALVSYYWSQAKKMSQNSSMEWSKINED